MHRCQRLDGAFDSDGFFRSHLVLFSIAITDLSKAIDMQIELIFFDILFLSHGLYKIAIKFKLFAMIGINF